MNPILRVEETAHHLNSPSDQALFLILNQLTQQNIGNIALSDIKHAVPSAGVHSGTYQRLERSMKNLENGGLITQKTQRRGNKKGNPERTWSVTPDDGLALYFTFQTINTALRSEIPTQDLWARKGGYSASDDIKYTQKMAYALSFYNAIQNGQLDSNAIKQASNSFPEIKSRNEIMKNIGKENFKMAQHRIATCKKVGLLEEISQEKTLRLKDIRKHFYSKPSGLGKQQQIFSEYLSKHPEEFTEGEIVSYRDFEKTGLTRPQIKGLVNHMSDQISKETFVNTTKMYQMPHTGRFIAQNLYLPLANFVTSGEQNNKHDLNNLFITRDLLTRYLKLDSQRIEMLSTHSSK